MCPPACPPARLPISWTHHPLPLDNALPPRRPPPPRPPTPTTACPPPMQVITLDTAGANYRSVWAMHKHFPHVKTFVRAFDIESGERASGRAAGHTHSF